MLIHVVIFTRFHHSRITVLTVTEWPAIHTSGGGPGIIVPFYVLLSLIIAECFAVLSPFPTCNDNRFLGSLNNRLKKIIVAG